MNSAVKVIAAYAAFGVAVLLWALSFGNVIDRDAVPFMAVISLALGWLAFHVSSGVEDWPNKGRATMYLFVWLFAVVTAIGIFVPGSGCYTDWDGRSNATICP